MNNECLTIQSDTYLVGDIHGHAGKIFQYIQRHELSDCAFILLGDIGLGFHTREEEQWQHYNSLLQANCNHFYLIRGNHDNPHYWQQSPWSSPLSHVHFLADGQILFIGSKKYIALGGAISVDRCRRQTGLDYWPEEGFTPPPAKIENLHGVLAHTGPFAQGWGGIMSYILRDTDLRHDLAKEEDDILASIDLQQAQEWYCGHFHFSQSLRIHNTQCRCLDIEEIYPLKTQERNQ